MTTYCDSEGGCGREIVGARSDAEFCSNACRQREYRRRKKILAPWGGDADALRADLLGRQAARQEEWRVTANSAASRNGGESA